MAASGERWGCMCMELRVWDGHAALLALRTLQTTAAMGVTDDTLDGEASPSTGLQCRFGPSGLRVVLPRVAGREAYGARSQSAKDKACPLRRLSLL